MSILKKIPQRLDKAVKLLVEYETKLILLIGVLLVGIVAFELGIIQGQKIAQKPIVIESQVNTQFSPQDVNLSNFEPKKDTSATEITKNKCNFVGSKNSDKIHALSCTWAKRIKEENIVCFESIEEAKNKKYKEGSCIK